MVIRPANCCANGYNPAPFSASLPAILGWFHNTAQVPGSACPWDGAETAVICPFILAKHIRLLNDSPLFRVGITGCFGLKPATQLKNSIR